MTTVSPGALRAAEHFIMRNARLIDRHRFAYHFQNGPAEPVYTVLQAYRNIDGGYGNGLEPDLRGHGSQPTAVETALRYLDELGPIPKSASKGICEYLTSVTNDDGGVPCVLPTAHYTEAAPWWREYTDFRGALNPTAAIAGLMHKHHISHPWRDRATAFCWTRLDAMHWTDPYDAVAACTFLGHAPDRQRAQSEFNRIAPMILAVVELDPDAPGHVHRPLDIAPHPNHIARRLFTDAELSKHLDTLQRSQESDGGWPITWTSWAESTALEWRSLLTLQYLLTLRAYGRLSGYSAPLPRSP